MIFGRICPYCRERVKKNALVCRYCHRELEPLSGSGADVSVGMLVGMLGIAAGTALAMFWGYFRERRRWEQDQREAEHHEYGE